ncbi:protocadherin alpha-9 [Biomphalaria glabrata]
MGLQEFIIILVTLTVSHVYGDSKDITYRLREEQDIGTYVGNIARDSLIYSQFNASDFQNLEYNLPSTVSKFTIDRKTSTVKTAQVLDREAECDRPDVPCVIAFDVSIFRGNKDSGYSLLKIIKVIVTLEDINDNAPQFPSNETTLDAPESLEVGQILMTSGAIDRDSPPNNTVQTYTMEGGNGIFELRVIPNAGSGLTELGVVLKQKLDRESVSSYRLKITAEDGGFPQLTGTVIVNIRVIDVNDNAPIFAKAFFNASVPEDKAERSVVLQLQASDPDEGENARLSYTFTVPTSPKITEYFTINESSGEVSLLKRLDFEKDRTFRFGVTVNDNGYPMRSSQATVQIDVLDVNDNAPEIDITLPSPYIKESMSVGSYVAHVSVSDGDSSQNSVISCNMSNDHFILQHFPGSESILTVILNAPLDYEKSQREIVNITCQDGGDPPLSDSSSFILFVQNVNDNPPVFTRSSYRINFDEENYVGQFVVQIQAVDPDGDSVSYSLLVNPDKKFHMNPTSGVIKAMKTLDREDVPLYELVVQAKDNGAPPLSSSVTVTVALADINDNPPKFTSPHFELRVQENRPQNTVVGSVSANDPDIVSENHLRYRFPPNFTYSDLFFLDDLSGILSTKAPLDRETQDRYSFDILVVDDSKPTYFDTAHVTVTVTDDNDNKPVILYPNEFNSTFFIPMTSPPGSAVFKMECKDADSGENSSVKFSILRGNEKGMFYMNSMNGELVLANRLSVNDVGTFILTVMARDNGVVYLESQRDVSITVLLSNGTFAEPQEDDHVAGANMAIIVALICVTAVIGVAVLIAICVIRQVDRKREGGRCKVDSHDMYKPGVDMSTAVMESADTEQERLKRKMKQDLSFEADPDYARQTSLELHNKTSFSTFKTVKFLPEDRVHDSLTHQSVLHNTFSPAEGNVKRSHYVDKDVDIKKLTSTSPGQVQTAVHMTRNDQWPTIKTPPSSAFKHPVNDVIRKCSGGRGEEGDGHRLPGDVIGAAEKDYFDHNGFLCTSELPTTPKTSSNTTTANTSSGSSTQPRSLSTTASTGSARKRLWQDMTSSTESSRQESGFAEAGFKPNISFSDDSVTANTVVESSVSVPPKDSVFEDQPKATQKDIDLKPTPLHNSQTSPRPFPFTPRRSQSPDNQKVTPFGYSGTPYRLLTTNLSKIQSVDSAHGMYVEGSSLSIFEPSGAGHSRSYVNASRLPTNNLPTNNLPKPNDVTLSGGQRSSHSHGASRYVPDKDSRCNPQTLISLAEGYSLHDIDEILENTLRADRTVREDLLEPKSAPRRNGDLVFRNGTTISDGVSYQDDDSLTTTINAEDLCQEINELFFKDIFV